MWEQLSLVKIKDNGGLEWSGFSFPSLRLGRRMAMDIMSPYSTFHTIYIAMNCLFAACSGGQRWKQFCVCQKDVWTLLSLSLFSIYLTSIYVWVCVFLCVYEEELWQTKLDSVGGVNSITFFFSLHISESDSTQVLRPITWRDIERDVLYKGEAEYLQVQSWCLPDRDVS